MRKILVTIVGRDRPGIVHQVSRALAELECNILEVNQTTLLGEFAGLFSTEIPASVGLDGFFARLSQYFEGSGLAVWIKESSPGAEGPVRPAAPYVITVVGPDQRGIIPEFAGTIAGFDINIDSLRALSLSDSRPDNPAVLVFEVSVPEGVHQSAFRQALNLKAEELGLELSLQHRDIFEAIHRL